MYECDMGHNIMLLLLDGVVLFFCFAKQNRDSVARAVTFAS